jgi:hypothetical protein
MSFCLRNLAPYDAFEHLWRSIFPFDAREKLMAMLTVYADESGTDGRSPIVAVGGYVSEVPLWDDFQNAWNEMRIEKGIDVWHTAYLLSGKGDFTPDKGWNAERVADAVQAADDIIEKYALYGVTAYTNIADCEIVFPLRDENGTRKKFSAEYLLSGLGVVNAITGWAEENEYTEPIRFVFEDGANGRGYLMDALKHAKKSKGVRAHLIGGVSLEDKKKIPQLHPADKLIHLACNTINLFDRDRDAAREAIRQLVKAKLGKVLVYDKENLPLLPAACEAIRLQREEEVGRQASGSPAT